MRRHLLLLVALTIALGAGAARATISSDRYEIQARLSVQNSFQHNGVSSIDWVQERNELRLDVKYDLIPAGQPFLNFISKAKANMLYRGRYDSVFDARGAYRKREYDRDDFRFPEGEYPRELFLDLEFTGALRRLGARIGRQQVVWGEADLFRSIDVVNPLRLDQNELLGEDFADYREPLWIAKFLYDVGAVGPVENGGLEFFYSPNSRPISNRLVFGEAYRLGVDRNNSLTGFTRNNALPFNQVRYPWELSRIGPHYAEAQDFAEVGPPFGTSDFVYLVHDDWDKSWFSFSQSMAGLRFLGQLFGVDFTLNYIFKRAELPGTALYGPPLFDQNFNQTGGFNARLNLITQALLAGTSGPAHDDLVRRCVFDHEPLFVLGSIHGEGRPLSACQPVKFWYPWTHILGFTATYNDNKYTGGVFRMEESISTKEPRNGVPPLAGPRAGNYPTTRDFATNAMRDTMVWRSMIGFDYLRSFNLNAARKWPQPFHSLFGQDQWLLTMQFFDEYYAHADHQIGLGDSVTDREQQFNPLITLVATGFFVQQRLRPWIALGYEVDTSFPFAWLQAEYNIGRQWTIRAGEILWMGSRHAENFLFLNKYADRDELFLRLTYYLL